MAEFLTNSPADTTSASETATWAMTTTFENSAPPAVCSAAVFQCVDRSDVRRVNRGATPNRIVVLS